MTAYIKTFEEPFVILLSSLKIDSRWKSKLCGGKLFTIQMAPVVNKDIFLLEVTSSYFCRKLGSTKPSTANPKRDGLMIADTGHKTSTTTSFEEGRRSRAREIRARGEWDCEWVRGFRLETVRQVQRYCGHANSKICPLSGRGMQNAVKVVDLYSKWGRD